MNFQLLETHYQKILSILKGLNSSKTADIDNVSSKYLKGSADVLADQSLSFGIFLLN